MEQATFGAGCFWGVEKWFKKMFPSIRTCVGYTGGALSNPTYEQVCGQQTRHVEAVQITFDPAVVSYRDLVVFFYELHDPTTMDAQGPDRGPQYASAAFYHNTEQERIAQEVTAQVAKDFKLPIVTRIQPSTTFWTAEEYHQNYLEKHPTGYCSHLPRTLKKR
ncbi:MAG: hypothetical protein KVP17_003718 [Porospora cf. gigantea B]|uniref:uncharacterized protein n=1 Tax=Porospora cf. gigantea B TaxID=2853592 RepID=UPI003571C2FD|nr:MAG: hypothetical protein KVP17_003718 [Porospora cf. gigantea B]